MIQSTLSHLRLSRYAVQSMHARPELAEQLAAGVKSARERIAGALEGAARDDEVQLKRRLRRLRQEVLLATMARDLAGTADLAEVCATMSDLAEETIRCALAWTETRLAGEHGMPRGANGAPQHLIVIGMGKLGGRELNVSSDIDLVFVYPEEGETDAAAAGTRSVSNHEFFGRAGRKLISLLAEVTEDGFVFRVDMRLRPYGDSGPLAAGFEALENYFLTQGREWERYAWIKARALSGGRDAELAQIVHPFVYRKYLDYGTLAAMRRLHAEVRREVARRELAEHVKLGPGGIREIEFIAQALQLVRGGRDAALCVRPTLEALQRLAARGMIGAEAAAELARAYVFLRNLEHRLQYLDDRQTHTLPEDAADRACIATMSGFDSWEAFSTRLAGERAAVSAHFEEVLGNERNGASTALPEDAAAAAAQLTAQGYGDAQGAAAGIAALRASQRYAQLPEDSRARIETLLPALAAAAARTPAPDATLARGIALIEAIARRASYLALLAEHPEALERVTKMIAVSSWTAAYVTRHPLLLDELLDDRVLYAPPDWPAFARELRAQLGAHAGDTERQMNLLREQHQAQIFRLLAQDLAGLLTVERLADHLSALADLALEVTLELAWSQLRGRHREDAPRFAVIGYGKLGGKELGYASDLDIIFLYDDPDERAPEVYARLASRVNNWLTSHTSSGVLFDTDLRLRPSGASGLLVSSLAAFEEYQEKQAWLWEHQALTRARFCAGARDIGAAFEALREKLLRRKREAAALAREVSGMREKIHAAHPNVTALFDVKHDRGGMIDVEFAVQYLVLLHAHAHPRLTGNLGNIALLGIAAELGLLPPGLAGRCRDAYREFRRLQHALRLNGAPYARVPQAQVEAQATAVRELWRLVLGTNA